MSWETGFSVIKKLPNINGGLASLFAAGSLFVSAKASNTCDTISHIPDSHVVTPSVENTVQGLLNMPLDEFLKSIRSSGMNTDVDSFELMSNEEFAEYITKSFHKPARTEIDTVLVHSDRKYQKNGKFYDELISDGIYYNNFNLIKINYYVPANDSAESIKVSDIKNSRIKSAWLHEDKHAQDWLYLLNKIANLNINQLCEIAIHNEIVARLATDLRLNPSGKSADEILRNILENANKTFYLYIANKQFITDIDYMLSIIAGQLKQLAENNISRAYLKVSFNEIIREKYTFDGVCILDDLSIQTKKLLANIIRGVKRFDEFSQDFSDLKRERRSDRNFIRATQKNLFYKITRNKERGKGR